MKLDVFAHVLPERYLVALERHLVKNMATDRLRYYREGLVGSPTFGPESVNVSALA